MISTTVNILIAEDSPTDTKIIQRTLQKSRVSSPIFFVRDGEEAIDFLFRRGPYADPHSSPRPDLVLLDIKMPKVSGTEVLRLIKNEPALRRIPVTMLTTFGQSEDVNECYDLGANCYIVKPLDFDSFSRAIEAFCNYWTSVVTLPNGFSLRRE